MATYFELLTEAKRSVSSLETQINRLLVRMAIKGQGAYNEVAADMHKLERDLENKQEITLEEKARTKQKKTCQTCGHAV
jgi:hypothetical protein